jgi:regulator of RNase E activity RraA
MLAVEGDPTCTATVPAAAPSSVKVTVPEGSVEPTVAGVMLTDTGKVLPSAGVVVDGVTTVVVVVLATVKQTLGEI